MAGVLQRTQSSDLEQPVLPKRLRVPARVAALRNDRAGESSPSSSENLTPVSQCGETPTFGRNELFRLTSVRRALTNTDLWESLPSSSKAFLILSCAATVVIIAFCTQQLVHGPELLHIVLAMLVTAVFFLMLVIDAILHENAFELLASAVLALCVAARVLYFAVTKHHPRGILAVCVLLIILVVGDLCLALATYSQFGWRVYSKIACDPRAKDGKDRRKTHMIVSIFTMLMKLDTQLLLILFVIAVSTSAKSTEQIPRNQPMLILNPLGLLLCLVWLGVTFLTVRDEVVKLEIPLVIALPFCYIMPVADIILAFNKEHPTEADARTSLTLSAVLFIAVRSLVFLVMQACIARFKHMHAHNRRAHSEVRADRHGIPEDIPKELVPLMKGAWVGKPATAAKRKRRFFQLSTDGSTLRWAWDKYILMYYVEEQVNNNSDLEITLKMVMEADLHLKFFNSSQYTVWKEGFAMLLRLLNSPSSLTNDGTAPALPASLFPGDGTFQRSLSQNSGLMQQILNETKVPGGFSPKKMLRRMGFNTARRPSILDPNNKRLHEAANRVRAMRKMGIGALTGNATVTAQVSIGSAPVAKKGDANHTRNLTIPSIEEFVEIMKKSNKQEKQEQSPRRQEEGLQRASSSFLAKGKELVITALSPNTRRPRVRVRNQGSPTSNRSAARVLFSESGPAGETAQGATAPASLRRSASAGTPTPRRTRSGFSWFRDSDAVAAKAQLSKEGAQPAGAPELMRASTLDLRHLSLTPSMELKRTASGSEAVDSRECLDTVGPLPGDSRTTSAEPSPSKPQATQALAQLPSQKPKEGKEQHGEIQIVVHNPGQEDTRLEAAKRSSGDASSTAIFQPSWKIQRTRTASGSGSILGGASPRTLRTDFSGAFNSDSSSSGWGGTVGTHSNTSSISSFNSLGPPGGIQIAIQFIDYEDLTFGRCLGSGSEGSVYGAWYQETPVAVKQTTSQGEVEMNLHAGSHDNIVALRGLSQSDDHLFLVMEYCPKGTLDLLIHGQAPAQWDPARLVQPVRSIARGMLHLHTRKPPILHRDLKPANIFVGHGMLMKVGDFGMSRHVLMNCDGQGRYRLERQLTRSTIGTAAYCAPELMELEDDESPRASAQITSIDRADRILKSDVYSFGVTVWEILTRKRPHADMNSFQISYAWSTGEDMSLPPVPVPDNLSPQGRAVMRCLSDLAADCTQLDRDKRPSFHDILARIKPLTGSGLGSATPAWLSPKAPRPGGLPPSGSGGLV